MIKQFNTAIYKTFQSKFNKIKLNFIVVSRMIIERKRINLKNLPNPSPARALSSRKNPYHRKLSKNPDFLTEVYATLYR